MYFEIRNEFYKDTHAVNSLQTFLNIQVILVYDVTKRQTFENIDTWIQEMKTFMTNDVLVYLVANKIELERQVTTQEGKDKATDISSL